MPRPRLPINAYGRVNVDAVKYENGAGKRRRLVIEKDPEKGHGHWRARTLYRLDTGKVRQIERFGTTGPKAEAALRAALTSIVAGTHQPVKRETRLSDLAGRFLATKQHLSPRSVETYTHTVNSIIVPGIGDLAISEATTDRLQRFIDQVTAQNGPGAAKTTRAMLSGMMGLAARSDAITTNPVRELGRITMTGKGAIPVPLDQLPKIIAMLDNDNTAKAIGIADLIACLAVTGLRISEAIALDWGDIDLGAGILTVRQSKTTAGERRIVVPAALIARLKAREQVADAVFPTLLRKRRDRRATSAQWQETRERLGLPAYTFHSFRKAVGTALDQAGLTARDVAEYLGHADPSLTQRTYMSKTVGGSRAAEALELFMSVPK